MLNFPAPRIFLLSLAITSLATAAVVDQQVLAPQTLTAPLSGQISKSYSFAATSAAGKLTLINGDGTDLTPQICSGNIVQKLSCQLNNTLKQLLVTLTRPKSVEVKLNNQNAFNAIAWNPAVGKYTLNVPLSSQNQLQMTVKGFWGSSATVSVSSQVTTAPPVPAISVNPLQGFAPLTISASGAGTTDPDTNPSLLSYSWSFGDGTSAIGIMANHIYTMPGQYVVTLTVTDPLGASASKSAQVNVIQNQAPLAKLVLASAGSGIAPLMVYFDSSTSSDPDGHSLSYRYNFGDGTEVDGNPTATHEYKTPGVFSAIVTVKDIYGASSQANVTVTVTAPVLPPDPVTQAPSLANNPAPSLTEQVSFLYSGPNPIQKNVDPVVMDEKRMVVAKGRVIDGDGNPVSGVKVSLLNETMFGETVTRDDGHYDFVFNAGGNIVIDFSRNGYLRMQRNLSSATPQDFYTVDDVVLSRLDDKVTSVSLGSNQVQVAQSSPQSDSDGDRTGTIILPKNTQAELLMPDGSTKSVSTLSLRVTEFTVGDNGPKKMPARLPPRSAYTYAAELSADEAIAVGAKSIQFSKPVAYYVDNFLNMPVGTAVPLGVYDYQKGFWKAERDGIVIQILSIANGLAVVDLGSGQPATQSELDYFYFTTEELQKLASLYPAGKTLSRIAINHFSTVDLNYMASVSQVNNAVPPDNKIKDNCEGAINRACTINISQRILQETLSIPGTSFELTYSTDRVNGRKAEQSLRIPLTSDSVAQDLVSIEVDISVAGATSTYSYPTVTPNLEIRHIWNGRDAYGRELTGTTLAQVKLRYYFKNEYYYAMFDKDASQTFDTTIPGTQLKKAPGRGVVYAERTYNRELKSNKLVHEKALNTAGLWTFNVHHFYDRDSKTLYKGNGQTLRAKNVDRVVTTIGGTGAKGFSGDGGPVTQAQLNLPNNYFLGPDGSFYFSDSGNNRIRKVDRNGIITTIAGTGTKGFSGDGGLAVNADINNPSSVNVDRNGNVYFSDNDNERIRKVSADGIITTIAGTGVAGYSGDEGPAVNAQVRSPRAIVISTDGSIYISDSGNHMIRRITPDGIIHRFAGVGTAGYSGDGGSALQAQLNNPNFTSTSGYGEFFIADTNNHVIRKISPSGIITTVAGNGTSGFSGDEGPATSAQLNAIGSIKVNEGQLYISDNGNDRIRYVDALGIIHTLIGTGATAYNGENLLAAETNMNNPTAVYYMDDESIIYVDRGNHRIRRLAYPVPGTIANNQVVVPSAEGNETYIFDLNGNHLQTLFADSGTIKYQFAYDSNSRLVSIQDANSNVTQIQRDSSGNVAQIIAPFGQISQLSMTANGYLSQLRYPMGNTFNVSYSADGLMTAFSKPLGNSSQYEYDSFGYLIKDTGPDGGVRRLALKPDGIIEHTSPMGRTEKFQRSSYSDLDYTRHTSPMGFSTTSIMGRGINYVFDPFGMTTTTREKKDSRLLGLSKFQNYSSVSLKSGVQNYSTTMAKTRTYSIQGPYSFTRTEKATLDADTAKTVTSVFKTSNRTLTTTTGLGRSSTVQVDTQGRPLVSQSGNFASIQLSYDTKGRLYQTAQSGRVMNLNYNSQGQLSQITDALGRSTIYSYNANGNLISTTKPDGHVVQYSYDANSNMIALKPPQRSSHSFDFSPWDLFVSYKAPMIGNDDSYQASYSYDKDKLLTLENRADGQSVAYSYDSDSRLTNAQSSTASESIQYLGQSLPQQTSSSDGIGLSYQYLGSLMKTRSYSGNVSALLNTSYSPIGMLLESQSINGNTLNFSYDKDNLLTQAGDLILTRATVASYVVSSQLGYFTETYSKNTYGEAAQKLAQFNGVDFYKEVYTRDAIGRIITKIETAQGVVTQYDYSYDVAGRLTDVKENGIPKSHYDYDPQGNRLNNSAQYDAQDRLIQYGSSQYTYTKNGELETKLNNANSDTSTYVYDVFGQLKSVRLPSGMKVEYLTDGERHRVIKKVDGNVTKKFIYDEFGRLVGELNAANQLVSRFVYAMESHSPDYMISSSAIYRFIKDQLGSIRFVANTNDGMIAQQISYDEFGVVTQDTNPGFQPFGFAGGIYDEQTKLVRFGARDYDAEIGRWTAKDPILFRGRETNLYGYVFQDPVNFIDPLGLIVKDVDGIIPSSVKNTRLYKDLNARPDEIFVVSNSNLPALGRTTMHDSMTTQLIQINENLHRNSADFIDTLMHELNHANQNLTLDAPTEGNKDFREFLDTNINLPEVKDQLGGKTCP